MEEFEAHEITGCVCNDYDIVWEDIPINTNSMATGPYCCPGYRYISMEEKESDYFTNCWPRDWLAQDCDRLRIIGVNYETNLSLWTPICPVEKVKTLEERSDELLEQLVKVEVGNRPIVWVTHSMGGLMVKCLLNKGFIYILSKTNIYHLILASESDKQEIKDVYLNTKGIVFYSTPHLGSSVASFSQASALVIWPSIEVQELQKGNIVCLAAALTITNHSY